jgi:hypothetical protein
MATKELPPGYMWLGDYVVRVSAFERDCQEQMAWFDHFGRESYRHWSNDPSYDWVAQTKRKREKP